MQKFSNMPLSEVASAAVPAARRVAVPTAKPASLSAEALNIPRSGIRDVFDRVERVPDAISLTVGEPSATAAPHIVAAACEAAQAGQRARRPRIPQGRGRLLRPCEGTHL